MRDDAYALVEGPGFSVGRILTDAMEALFRNFPRLLVLVLIMAVPLLVWLVMGGERLLLGQFAAEAGAAIARGRFGGGQFGGGHFGPGHFDWVLAVFIFVIALTDLGIHAAVTAASFRALLGEEGDILKSLGRAFIALPSVLSAGLFVWLVLSLGGAMLGLAATLLTAVLHWSFGLMLGLGGTVGLTMLVVRWWLLIPVIVVELSGPIEAIGRCAALTEGYRWKIFALLLIVCIPEGLMKTFLLLPSPPAVQPLIAILNLMVSGLFIAFNAVLAVTIYGHLRAMKEGSGLVDIAEVFE